MNDREKASGQSRLYHLRKCMLGLTQAQFTELLGCSEHYISKLERQKSPILSPSFVDKIMELCRSVEIDTLRGDLFSKMEDKEKARIAGTLKKINQDWLLNTSDEMFIRSPIGKEPVPFITEDGKPYNEELKYFLDDTETPPKKHYIFPEDRLFIIQEADPAEVEKRTELLARSKMLLAMSDHL